MNIHYEPMNWRARAKERKRRADELNDTLKAHHAFYWRVRTADLALRPYGVRLIVNDRVFHVYDGWPGSDRRKVSGSVWDGRKVKWRKPCVADHFGILGKLSNRPKLPRCAHRSWKSAKQQKEVSSPIIPFGEVGIGLAWTDDSFARDALVMLKNAGLDRGAPVPLCRQQEALTGRSSERRSYLVERGVAYPGAAVSHGGATAEEKRRQTFLDGQVNKAVGELRLNEKPLKWQRTSHLGNPAYWEGRVRPRPSWEIATTEFWVSAWRQIPSCRWESRPGYVEREKLTCSKPSKIPPPTGAFRSCRFGLMRGAVEHLFEPRLRGYPMVIPVPSRTIYPRCTEASGFTGKITDHPSWEYVGGELAKLRCEPQWEWYVTSNLRCDDG